MPSTLSDGQIHSDSRILPDLLSEKYFLITYKSFIEIFSVKYERQRSQEFVIHFVGVCGGRVD